MDVKKLFLNSAQNTCNSDASSPRETKETQSWSCGTKLRGNETKIGSQHPILNSLCHRRTMAMPQMGLLHRESSHQLPRIRNQLSNQRIIGIESHCHSSVNCLLYKHIHGVAEQFMRTAKRKKMSNLSEEEMVALKSLKSNNDIVICKTDKGNCIVVMNKEVYKRKTEEILEGQQFHALKSARPN